MYKPNKKHLQPLLISNVNDLPKKHQQRVGENLYQLLQVSQARYEQETAYQVVQRFFGENFQVIESDNVRTKASKELVSGSLQSLDDLEASYRQKGTRFYKGYVVNVSETCAPRNSLQLITEVQVAANNAEDADLLIEAVPARWGLVHTQIILPTSMLTSVEPARSIPTGVAVHGVSCRILLASTGLSRTKNSCGPNDANVIWHSSNRRPTPGPPLKPRCARSNSPAHMESSQFEGVLGSPV
jgi:hypothetical protein